MLKKDSDWINQALSSETYYGTPRLLSNNVLLRDRLDYHTINENNVLLEAIKQYRKNTKIQNWLIRLGIAVIGGVVGGVSGNYGSSADPGSHVSFDISDGLSQQEAQNIITGAGIGLTAGGLGVSALNMRNEQELEELGLSWMMTEHSYRHHINNYGEAQNRLLMILWNSSIQKYQTMFGIEFPDSYVAYLYPVNQSPICKHLNEMGYSYPSNSFAVSNKGLKYKHETSRKNLGSYTDHYGQNYPVELWHSNDGKTTPIIKYYRPQHSIY